MKEERINEINSLHDYYVKQLQEEQQEIDRLNNIINGLEKWLIDYRTFIDIPDYYEEGIIDCLDEVLDKLKALKEDNKC